MICDKDKLVMFKGEFLNSVDIQNLKCDHSKLVLYQLALDTTLPLKYSGQSTYNLVDIINLVTTDNTMQALYDIFKTIKRDKSFSKKN